MFFSETEIDFVNHADGTTRYTSNLKMENVIETLEKKILESYFRGYIQLSQGKPWQFSLSFERTIRKKRQ